LSFLILPQALHLERQESIYDIRVPKTKVPETGWFSQPLVFPFLKPEKRLEVVKVPKTFLRNFGSKITGWWVGEKI
jgi:hypothetical protein